MMWISDFICDHFLVYSKKSVYAKLSNETIHSETEAFPYRASKARIRYLSGLPSPVKTAAQEANEQGTFISVHKQVSKNSL